MLGLRRRLLKVVIAVLVLWPLMSKLLYGWSPLDSTYKNFADAFHLRGNEQSTAAKNNDTEIQDNELPAAVHTLWRPPCIEERKNFVYIKTHKTGSETVSAVFRRFGYARNLSFVLPIGDKLLLGWPWPLEPWMYRPSKTSGFNILCEHVIFHEDIIPAMMPSDTVYTTTLREPFGHLRSAFNYFGLGKVMGDNITDKMSAFLKSPQKWDDAYTRRFIVRRPLPPGACIPSNVSVVKNAQASDLGFPVGFPPTPKYRDQTDNETFIQEWIDSIDRRFELVMITEYLFESLVLWRRLMCWTMKDIVFYSINISRYKLGNLTYSDPALMENFREWSNLEFRLYDHFNHSLWQKIAQEGPDFWEEVEIFKDILGQVRSFCSSLPLGKVSNQLWITSSKWNQQLLYTRRDCGIFQRRLYNELKEYYESIPTSEEWKRENDPALRAPAGRKKCFI